jgi:3-hydroxyacyl-CoA dehydrogenase/enoyl-CoA hydratase/3-hydroxybutyryl-CoA epimerase
MVRTLFLERLRAERELAAPEGARLERIVTSPISAARAAWSEALAKVRLPQSADPALPADTLELIDGRGLRHRVALQVIGDPDRPTTDVRAVLAPAGPYGRVIEIVGADDAAAAALAALAARLWSLPWRTPGPQGVLARLHGTALERQAEIAAACAAQDGAGDPAFLDVAACLAGVTPAWSGGPLMWGRTRA